MFRSISVRKLALLLFGPMLVETLAMLFNSWLPLQAAARGYEPRLLLLIGAAGAITYSISSLVAGRWVTPRIAPLLMIGNILAVCVMGCLALWINEFWIMPVTTGVLGILIGHYYTPFQINMAHVRPFRTLAFSIGFYNIAWGSGSALGTLLGGSLAAQPVTLIAALAVVVTLVHTGLQILALKAPPPHHEEAQAVAFFSSPRQRRLAFVCFLAVGICFRAVLLVLWPALTKQRQFDDFETGVGYFLLSAPIPLGAMLWAALRHHLREPWVLIAGLVVGAVGMLLLPLTQSWAVNCVGLFLLGTMESCTVFHAIYYANADPKTPGRSAGLCEMLAGGGAVVGPILLGLLAWNNAASPLPYALGAGIVLAALLYCLRDRLKFGTMITE